MQTKTSQIIVRRFFEAVRELKSRKVIRGVQTFTTKYGINKRNFYTCEKQPERDMFQVAWLGYLVSDYGISADWLLTGEGDLFSKNIVKSS